MGKTTQYAPPRAIIIAGPNSAGKTTFANEFLPSSGSYPNFINADLIAAGLSPFHPEALAMESAKIMISRIENCISLRKDFAVETTLAGQAYYNFISKWKSSGYCVELLFLSLPSAELAIQRVAQRVADGGHSIPKQTIVRRFKRGFNNFNTIYKQKVDAWQLLDASFWPPALIDERKNNDRI